MRILVTGATGYLGRAIVRAAAARGHAPIAFARHASTSGVDCPAVDGDIRDRRAVAAAARDCDGICHSAALVAVWRRRRAEFDEVNVDGLRHVLYAVADHRIDRLVYTSSFLALPPSGAAAPGEWNDYQRTKVAAARLAADAVAGGAPLIRMYPGVIYGPGTRTEGNLVGRMIADHIGGKLPGVVGADRIWSFAFIDDVAAAHVAALERGAVGSTYTLGGENVPQMRPFEILHQLTGRRLPRRIPAAAAHAAAAVEQTLAVLFGRIPQLTRGTVRILEHDWPLDHELAARDLTYRVTPLADGVRRVVASIAAAGVAQS